MYYLILAISNYSVTLATIQKIVLAGMYTAMWIEELNSALNDLSPDIAHIN